MNEAVANPRVFISYCWYKEETKEWALRLAVDLQDHGIHVVIDQWDLAEGQDIYAFMESCVTDASINRVLVICDQAYSQKADNRSGGVGVETAIISKKVYERAKETKFIPIVLERSEDGTSSLPTYLSSRKFIDFSDSDNYYTTLEQLIRTIYNRPLTSRPPLGSPPAYITDENQPQFSCALAYTFLHRKCIDGKPISGDLKGFSKQVIVDILTLARVEREYSLDIVLEKISQCAQIRNLFYSALETCISYGHEDIIADQIHSFFERCLELLYYRENGGSDTERYSQDTIEHIVFELFVGSTSIFIKHKLAICLKKILDGQYFATRNGRYRSFSFCEFRSYSRFLEESYNARSEIEKRIKYHSVRGHLISESATHESVRMPDYIEADIFLTVKSLLSESEDANCWYPVLAYHIEWDSSVKLFVRSEYSQHFAELLLLLGVPDPNEFKKRYLAGHKRCGVERWGGGRKNGLVSTFLN